MKTLLSLVLLGPALVSAGSRSDSASWIDKLWSDPIATFTGALFLATFVLVVFGYLQWSIARETAKRQLRAYVALDDIYFRWKQDPDDPQMRKNIVERHDDGGPPRLRIRIKNFGHTPAKNVAVRLNGRMVASNGVDVKTNTARYSFSKFYEGGRDYPAPIQMLAPSQVYGVWVHLANRLRFDPHQLYDQDKNALLVWGAIIYEDIYERCWVTRFCYAYDGRNRFIPYLDPDYQGEHEFANREGAIESLSYS